MKLKSLYCPSCGGSINIDIDSGRKTAFCIHCGQQIVIDDEVLRSEHTDVLIDQARIKEADVEAQLEVERYGTFKVELENYHRRMAVRSIIGVIWGIVFFVVIIVAVICRFAISPGVSWMIGAGIGGALLIVGVLVLFIPSIKDTRPRSPYEIRKTAEERKVYWQTKAERSKAYWSR